MAGSGADASSGTLARADGIGAGLGAVEGRAGSAHDAISETAPIQRIV